MSQALAKSVETDQKTTRVVSSGIRIVSVAPMLDWTDRHFRRFARLITHHALLYSEMVTTGALLHGDRHRMLLFDPAEHPVALQLGGSDPADLSECAKMAEQYGYDEVNLNVGCPSPRVRRGCFGAALMAQPQLVAECIEAMRSAVKIPVTVKCRIGIDQQDSYDDLCRFVEQVSLTGCSTFIIHARKAWLEGLSPKENREIPPLRYDVVRQLKEDFCQLELVLNGGITDLDQAEQHLQWVDGVMIGREAYHNPWRLIEVDGRFYDDSRPLGSRCDVVEAYLPYLQQQLNNGLRLHTMTRHILGLFHGVPGARQWRRLLSEGANRPGVGVELLDSALESVKDSE